MLDDRDVVSVCIDGDMRHSGISEQVHDQLRDGLLEVVSEPCAYLFQLGQANLVQVMQQNSIGDVVIRGFLLLLQWFYLQPRSAESPTL